MINKFKKLRFAFIRENESLINWLLLGVIIIGFLLRVGGITAGLKGELRFYPNPDESNIVYTAFKMIQTGNFNPHPFWVYPTLYIYLQAMVQFLVYVVSVATRFQIPEFANVPNAHHYFYFFGRFLTVIFGTASIFILYQLTRELFNKKIALIAAALLAVTFVHLWASQIVTTDVPMTFFGLMAMYFSAKILKKDNSWRNYILAGIFIGLALATRYNAFIFLVPLFIGYLLTHLKKERLFPYFSLKGFFDGKLILSFILPFLVFVSLDPYTVLDLPHFLAEYTGVIRSYKQGIWLNLSIYENMPAWLWYLRYAATSGLYWPLFFAVLGGITFGMWPITKAKFFIFSYLFANFLLINSMATIMDRHFIQMSPYLVIFAAIFIVKIGAILYAKTGQSDGRVLFLVRGLFMAFLIVLFGLGVFRSVVYNRAVTAKDTRVQTAYWIEESLKKDSPIIGLGVDLALSYLKKEGYSAVYSVSTLGPTYKEIVSQIKGDYYVIITSVEYNWPRQYYKSHRRAAWAFNGLTPKELYDQYEKLKKESVLFKEISDPLFKSGFYGPGYLEMSSTVTTWHNPTVEIYKVFGVK